MSTLPPQPPPEVPAVPPLPWEARESRGLLGSFFDTWGLFLSRPREAWARARESGDLASPLLFGLATCWISFILNRILFALVAFPLLPGVLGRRFPMWGRFPMSYYGRPGLLIHAILSPIFIFVALFIGAAVLHLCCLIVGALSGSTSGFEGSFRVVGYSACTNIASVVPIVGPLLALVWWVVVAIPGIERMHHTTSGKATAAVLIPLLLCCGGMILIGLLAGAAMFMRHGT